MCFTLQPHYFFLYSEQLQAQKKKKKAQICTHEGSYRGPWHVHKITFGSLEHQPGKAVHKKPYILRCFGGDALTAFQEELLRRAGQGWTRNQ
jgi:hypothetical protein